MVQIDYERPPITVGLNGERITTGLSYVDFLEPRVVEIAEDMGSKNPTQDVAELNAIRFEEGSPLHEALQEVGYPPQTAGFQLGNVIGIRTSTHRKEEIRFIHELRHYVDERNGIDRDTDTGSHGRISFGRSLSAWFARREIRDLLLEYYNDPWERPALVAERNPHYRDVLLHI